MESDFSIGLIVGASGSGKTTLAKKVWGHECFDVSLDPELPIIDQLPKELSYDECAEILSGIGLTSVPCWIRPVKTLSNGQRARAEAAFAMTKSDLIVIDEWTSVVDRTVAKVMSHCVQKFARRNKKKIVLLSCHYDVIEWLNPDWIVDCNKQEYVDRRLLPPLEREKLTFDIREVGRATWNFFSKYHYLSEKLAGGSNFFYGLFNGENQIGFLAFSNYVPKRPGKYAIYHFNRLVIHPDYCGLGLGVRFLNAAAAHFKSTKRVVIMGKFSSQPTFRALSKDKNWQFEKRVQNIGYRSLTPVNIGGKGRGIGGMRVNTECYVFRYRPD